MTRRKALVVSVVLVVIVLSYVCVYVAAQSIRKMEDIIVQEAPAKDDFRLPTVKGLGSILEGWTFTNNWGTDDWMVDTILQAHGAKEADSGEIPDIRLEATTKDGDLVLWVRYRGQDRYVRKSDPSFSSQFTKVMVDMARLRLAELRQEISRKEGK